jgi:hypothetical protein
MTSRRWRWVSARGSADQPLAHCAESAAAIRPVSEANRAGSQTACLIKAGTLLNIWLYFHHGTRVIAVLGESSVCWIYGWTRRLTVPAVLALMHACGGLRVIPWKLACTACCTARLYNLVWTVSLSGLWPKAELKHPWDRTWCILFCLQNGTDKTRVDKVRYWTAVARLFLESICAGRSLWRLDLWRRLDLVMRIPVTTY